MKTMKFNETTEPLVLSGRKTETRRIVKGQPKFEVGDVFEVADRRFQITELRCEKLAEIDWGGVIAEGFTNDVEFYAAWLSCYGELSNKWVWVYTFTRVE